MMTKKEIKKEIRDIKTLEKAKEMEESEMEQEEKFVEFKLESKNDSRIYIAGTFDINSYDEDTDSGWEYEQNDGTYSSHLPRYWKVDGESLSFEYGAFIDCIGWEMFRQWIWDCQDEQRTIDCGVYYLHINGGACVELDIEKDDDFEENFHATLKFTHNHESIAFDEDIFLEFAEDLQFDENDTYIADKDNCSIYMEIPKTFSNYIEEDYEGENAEIISEWLETCRQYYARQLSRDAGIYAKYGEVIEQQVEDEIELDKDIMFEFKCAVSNDTVETFMVEHQYL